MTERHARKRLFGVYRNKFTDDPSVANISRSAANTHAYWHGGKLFVLKEDSLPYYVDPHTLATLGEWNWNGKYTATSMSAHPKVDPVTGEMIAYGYQAKGDLSTDIAVYTMSPKGEITKEVWLKSPYLGIIHDIAITQKYVVIPVIARTTSLERLKSGEPMWEWKGRPADVGWRAAEKRRGEGRALVQGPVAQHAALPERHGSRDRARLEDHDGAADVERRARSVADPPLDVRSQVEEGQLPRRSRVDHARHPAAHGRSLPVAGLSLRLRDQPRREPAAGSEACAGPEGCGGSVNNVMQRLDVRTWRDQAVRRRARAARCRKTCSCRARARRARAMDT